MCLSEGKCVGLSGVYSNLHLYTALAPQPPTDIGCPQVSNFVDWIGIQYWQKKQIFNAVIIIEAAMVLNVVFASGKFQFLVQTAVYGEKI